LWLYTGYVGVTFAYLAIALFRQDKKFSKIEFEKLCNFFQKEYGPEVGELTKAFVHKYKKVKVDLHYQTRQLAEFSRRDRLMFFYNLFSMAMANGTLKIEEERFLKHIAKLINLQDRYFAIIKSKFIKPKQEQNYREAGQSKNEYNSGKKTFTKKFFSSSTSAYLSLELDRNASNDELKKAYRRLVMKYHPDRLNGKSETLKIIAKQRFREITEAYELIKRERGIK
jgi:DnaJ like chaperone protein